MSDETKLMVETQYLEIDLPDGQLKLQHGGSLKSVTVAYESYGALNEAGTNAVLLCPTLTSDAHVAGYHSEDPKSVGWWDPLIGPGKAVDTNKYFVVCSNILGGCKGTTGPASVNPETGKPYGVDFPKVTIKDAVQVQKLLVEQLGVKHLDAVMGGSLGGMQALEWSLSYPDFLDKCICIASSTNLSPQALAFDVIARQEIEHDPAWNDGGYLESGTQPENGLSRARQIGHVTYLSSASMEDKFGRSERDGYAEQSPARFSTNFQVESYLNYQGRKFVERFDANSYLYITQMMDLFDLRKEYGSLAEAFKRSRCRYLVVSITSDWLFPPEQQLEIVDTLIEERRPVSYFSIDSIYGHDAFLIEYQQLSKGVDAFLNGAEPEEVPEDFQRSDVEEISKLLDKGEKHILDVGSGDGSFMLALRKTRGINGVCLDYDFDMVVSCMQKGLDAIHADAETGLKRIKSGSFDLVLLNQTIQQLQSALQTLKQILRIAPFGVISFPNFAFISYRMRLLLSGHLPVSDSLPYEWYNSPNIHVITLKDFRSLCVKHQITISEIAYVSDSSLGNLLISLGLPNSGAERVLVRLAASE